MSITPLQQIPLAQMGHVEKIAEVTQNQPQVQQQVSQETAKAELKEQSGQVPKIDKGQEAEKLRAERDGKRRQQPQTGQERRAKNQKDDESAGASPPEQSQEDTPPRGDNPWAGHIVNIKV